MNSDLLFKLHSASFRTAFAMELDVTEVVRDVVRESCVEHITSPSALFLNIMIMFDLAP